MRSDENADSKPTAFNAHQPLQHLNRDAELSLTTSAAPSSRVSVPWLSACQSLELNYCCLVNSAPYALISKQVPLVSLSVGNNRLSGG